VNPSNHKPGALYSPLRGFGLSSDPVPDYWAQISCANLWAESTPLQQGVSRCQHNSPRPPYGFCRIARLFWVILRFCGARRVICTSTARSCACSASAAIVFSQFGPAQRRPPAWAQKSAQLEFGVRHRTMIVRPATSFARVRYHKRIAPIEQQPCRCILRPRVFRHNAQDRVNRSKQLLGSTGFGKNNHPPLLPARRCRFFRLALGGQQQAIGVCHGFRATRTGQAQPVLARIKSHSTTIRSKNPTPPRCAVMGRGPAVVTRKPMPRKSESFATRPDSSSSSKITGAHLPLQRSFLLRRV